MEKDKKKDYYDEEKVWTKRKPKIKTKEQIEEELIEEKNNKKNMIYKELGELISRAKAFISKDEFCAKVNELYAGKESRV